MTGRVILNNRLILVLKSPQHLEQLEPLMETFPDATVVLTHRDPVSVIQSAITMLSYGDRMRRTRVNPRAVADYWIDRVERMLRENGHSAKSGKCSRHLSGIHPPIYNIH